MGDPAADAAERLTPGARRILDVASGLFYWRGIHAVGVDTIAAESGVTKRTLYNRFGSKDALVAMYLAERDRNWRTLIDAGRETAPADPVSQALVPFDVLPVWLAPNSRGCSFVNAFAELPDPEHPGHRLILEEKRWMRSYFLGHLVGAGSAEAEVLATQLVSLHEGAIINYAVVGDTTAPATSRRAAETLLRGAVTSTRSGE